MTKSIASDPNSLIELAATIPLEQLHARSDLPTTLLEATAAYIGTQEPAATIAEALADIEQPCLLPALLAAEASLGLSDDWIPLSERVTTAGGLTQDDAQRLRAVRLMRPAACERTTYRGKGSIGIAVWAAYTNEGAILRVQVALGGISSYPQRVRQVEAVLQGRRASEALIAVATETAVQESQPAGIGSLTMAADLETVRVITFTALRAVLF